MNEMATTTSDRKTPILNAVREGKITKDQTALIAKFGFDDVVGAIKHHDKWHPGDDEVTLSRGDLEAIVEKFQAIALAHGVEL